MNLTENGEPTVNESSMHSLTQYSFSDHSMINTNSKKQDNVTLLEKTLPIYQSPPKTSKTQADKNESLKEARPLKSNSATANTMTTFNSSSSGVAVGSLQSNSMSASSGGLFDRFLKNYNSSSSVMDEPELSFVSYHTNSNPSSPNPYSMTAASKSNNNYSSRKINDESSIQAQSRTNLSMGTSGCDSVSSSM